MAGDTDADESSELRLRDGIGPSTGLAVVKVGSSVRGRRVTELVRKEESERGGGGKGAKGVIRSDARLGPLLRSCRLVVRSSGPVSTYSTHESSGASDGRLPPLARPRRASKGEECEGGGAASVVLVVVVVMAFVCSTESSSSDRDASRRRISAGDSAGPPRTCGPARSQEPSVVACKGDRYEVLFAAGPASSRPDG